MISGTELVEEANDQIDADFLGILRTFLTVFAGVALLVATFSINNTFAIIAAQRQRSSALLRAIGADRRQVLASLVGEALLVGIAASVVGLVVGLGLAQGLKALFDAFGFALPAGGMTLQVCDHRDRPARRPSRDALRLARAGGAGVPRELRSPPSATLTSTVRRTSAVRAVDRRRADRRRRRRRRRRCDRRRRRRLGRRRTRSRCSPSAGVVVLGPIAARPAGAVLGTPIARLRGVPGALARRNAVRTPRRTAATASALMIGIGVVHVFTVFAGSLKAVRGRQRRRRRQGRPRHRVAANSAAAG